MGRVRYYMQLYPAYLRIGFLMMTQYPLDTVLLIVSLIIREAATFLGIFVIAGVTGGIGGWSLYEVGLLFGLGAMAEALSQGFMDMVWSIGGLCIRRGMMDIFLIRPAPAFFQLVGHRIHLQGLFSFAAAAILLMVSFVKLGITFSLGNVLFLLEFLVFGTMLNTSVYLVFNCLDFWLIQGNSIAVLVQTMREFAKYPLHVFPIFIKGAFTFLIPFGFIGYYPAAWLMGKTSIPVPEVLPFVAVIVCLFASLLWRAGISGYESTGT